MFEVGKIYCTANHRRIRIYRSSKEEDVEEWPSYFDAHKHPHFDEDTDKPVYQLYVTEEESDANDPKSEKATIDLTLVTAFYSPKNNCYAFSLGHDRNCNCEVRAPQISDPLDLQYNAECKGCIALASNVEKGVK